MSWQMYYTGYHDFTSIKVYLRLKYYLHLFVKICNKKYHCLKLRPDIRRGGIVYSSFVYPKTHHWSCLLWSLELPSLACAWQDHALVSHHCLYDTSLKPPPCYDDWIWYIFKSIIILTEVEGLTLQSKDKKEEECKA